MLGDLGQYRGALAGAQALADQRDRAADHPTVDLPHQPLLLRDRQECQRLHQCAVFAAQAQQRFVHLARLAMQIDHRLVMHDETIGIERVADARDPGRDAFFLGAVDGARIEQLDAVAADTDGRLHTLAGLAEHGRDVGDLLADLHAADTDGGIQRAAIGFQHVLGERGAHRFGKPRGGGMVAVAAEHGELVLAEARGDIVRAQHAAQAFGDRGDQLVRGVQADFMQQSRVVVRLDQQQAVRSGFERRFRHAVFERAQERCAVEQSRDLVALAQFLDLAGQFGVELLLLPAQHQLHAVFAFIGGRGEFHHRLEGLAVQRAGLDLVSRRRRLALGHLLEQLLEAVDMLRCDHVQQRHALDFLERVVAEHLEVGGIGADVHAFVDVGDRVARGLDQRVAAAIALAHLRLQPAQAAARFQVGPFGAHLALHMLDAPAQHDPTRIQLQRAQQARLVDRVHHQQHRQILAAGGNQLHDPLDGNAARTVRRQHQFERLVVQQVDEFALVLGTRRTHGDAAVAQTADDGLGRLDAVVDDQQPQGRVLT